MHCTSFPQICFKFHEITDVALTAIPSQLTPTERGYTLLGCTPFFLGGGGELGMG